MNTPKTCSKPYSVATVVGLALALAGPPHTTRAHAQDDGSEGGAVIARSGAGVALADTDFFADLVVRAYEDDGGDHGSP